MKYILAIDDQKVYLKKLRAIVKSNMPDCKVLTASSGKEGIKIAQKEQPDTILLDITMPDMDGYETCKRLQEDKLTKHIPVMITGRKIDIESRIKALNMGAIAFLAKPINPKELIAQINMMLRIKKAEDILKTEKENLEDLVKKRENELLISQEKYRNIVEIAPDGIATISLTGFITSCNNTFLELTGFEHDDLVGKHISKLPTLRLKDVPKYLKVLESLIKGEQPKPFEFIWIHKSGEMRMGEARLIATESNGKISGFQLIASDITERKQAEEKLRESEEKYRGLFDESIAAVYLFDEKKNFLDSNQAGLELLGYSREELLSMSIPDVDADPKVVLPAHEQLLSGHRIINYEHKLLRKDGKVITVLNNSRPLANDDGQIFGMQSTLIDITERKNAEEVIKKKSKELENLNTYFVDREFQMMSPLRLGD